MEEKSSVSWPWLLAGAILFVGIAAAAYRFLLPPPPPPSDPKIVQLRALLEVAKESCLLSEDSKAGAEAKAKLELLIQNVESSGSITAYKNKYVGASQALPPELQASQDDKIRRCMSRYNVGIFKTIGVDIPEPRSMLPNPLELRFSVAGVKRNDTLRVNLTSSQRFYEGLRLSQQDQGYYPFNAAFPASEERLRGSVVRELQTSTRDPLAASAAASEFCLQRSPQLPANEAPFFHLSCTDRSCRVHEQSPAWLTLCPADAARTASGFSLFASALAAEPDPGWSVPSVATLDAHRDLLKGVGYTLFTIETSALQKPGVLGVEIDIRVNGIPILEDSLEPRQRPVPYDGSAPFRYTFALEALDFQGIQGGCEAIALVLTPRLAGDHQGEPLHATLAYVALRDMPPVATRLGEGRLTWSASYVIPPAEWSHEAFITSVIFDVDKGDAAFDAARERAVSLKHAFDQLGLKDDGAPLVAVIRPPLSRTGSRLAYGLAAGVVQPSGKVRFTFPFDKANSLAQALLSARQRLPAAASVIEASKYVYQVAGNAQRRQTPTPPGTCRHVSADLT
jgi:hypothetical protein